MFLKVEAGIQRESKIRMASGVVIVYWSKSCRSSSGRRAGGVEFSDEIGSTEVGGAERRRGRESVCLRRYIKSRSIESVHSL